MAPAMATTARKRWVCGRRRKGQIRPIQLATGPSEATAMGSANGSQAGAEW